MKRKLLTALACGSLLMVLAACGSNEKTSTDVQTKEKDQPQQEVKKETSNKPKDTVVKMDDGRNVNMEIYNKYNVKYQSHEPTTKDKDAMEHFEKMAQKHNMSVPEYISKEDEIVAANVQKEKQSSNKVEFSEEGKKMALEQVRQNPQVRDAHIEVQGKKIIMAVIVSASVNKDTAKEIGDNFVRNLGAFLGGKPPEKYYYGEVFDNYDLQIGVGTSPDNIIVQGAKVTTAKGITW